MKTDIRIAADVRQRVARSEPGTFLRGADFDGDRHAVEVALGRLVARGEIARARKGLYWRGTKTRFGMTQPSPLAVALAVAGPGAGPSGIAAAHILGLTTQVAAVAEVAVPGRCPEPIEGVRFRARPYSRREQRLTTTEVAVLEVLRDPSIAEARWPEIVERVHELVADGRVRAGKIAAAVACERRVAPRHRWDAIAA